MFVWSKRLVTGLLAGFVLLIGIFLLQGEPETISGLKIHTTRWMAVCALALLCAFRPWLAALVILAVSYAFYFFNLRKR